MFLYGASQLACICPSVWLVTSPTSLALSLLRGSLSLMVANLKRQCAISGKMPRLQLHGSLDVWRTSNLILLSLRDRLEVMQDSACSTVVDS